MTDKSDTTKLSGSTGELPTIRRVSRENRCGRQLPRRNFNQIATASTVAWFQATATANATAYDTQFELRYILGSCLYGYMYVGEIFPEVRKAGATAIDIWPKVHGNQREQLDGLGAERFAEMLGEYDISLGCITQYALGPFGLREEMRLAQRFGCPTLVTGGAGPVGLKGSELKRAIGEFCEKLKPHLAVAEETGVTLAIENHANNLIDSPDSLKWLAELSPSDHLGIAFAPYHLPQDANLLADLILALGASLKVFYAWQHGMGCMQRLPKEQELLQMPGRGDLDFGPLVQALRQIKFSGWTEIFMHPFPRGIPILESAAEVTEEINRARAYLAQFTG